VATYRPTGDGVQKPIGGQVAAILSALDARRPKVAGHSRRVSAYAVQLAHVYGLSAEMVETLRVGGLLHDIGKLMIPVGILEKPGRLTEQEWERLQSHPERGFDMLSGLGFDETVTDIVLYHHERLDGSGYPDGLTGDLVPWSVRIISVMDTFDALTSPRTYREALSVDAARTLLARESVGRYCPWAVNGLLSIPRSVLDAVVNGEPGSYRPDACPSPDVMLGATMPWTGTWNDEPTQVSAW
jgi:putative nucleotidyltransferase with HDIG domain